MKAEEEMHREETTPEREPGPMLNELGWKAMEYVLMWPFMCHIASVFVVAWIASLLHFHVFFIFLLGLMYLYQVLFLVSSMVFSPFIIVLQFSCLLAWFCQKP
jgi:hypothetical protein